MVAGGSSKDATLPVRRGGVGGFSESAQVAREALGLGDQGEQAHAGLAPRAREHVEQRVPRSSRKLASFDCIQRRRSITLLSPAAPEREGELDRVWY